MAKRDELETIDDLLGRADTVQRPEDGKLVAQAEKPKTEDRRLIDALPRLNAPSRSDFVLKNTLGEGGMGLVRIAEQTAIGRDVAVKTLRPDRTEPRFALQLLREAWLTGALEHPNIIPIYSVGIDDQGLPMIVMKKVEGTPWDRIIHEETRELKWHLRTLIQVCNAVEFAGSHGIVHRDLKPGNVMIGRFGEVYVLDWGIAVSLSETAGGRLPLACDVQSISGTPGYMAPEMVVENGKGLGPHTDVYLLGAILHELITKEKRHTGGELREVLLSSLASEPVEYSDSIPPELAEICNRATAAESAARFPSAGAFHRALERYLEQEDSRQLAQRAQECLLAWQALASPEPIQVQDYFSRCKFGFSEALRSWPDNQVAQRGLQIAFERMFEFELERDQLDSATLLLAEISGRPDLRKRLEGLEARLVNRRKELEGLRHLQASRDLSVGRRTRAFVMCLTALTWGGLPLLLGYLERSGIQVGYTEFYGVSLIKLINGVLIVWWARDSLGKTAVNRELTAVTFLLMIVEVSTRPFAQALERPIGMALLIDFGIYAIAIAVLAITLDRRLFYAPIVYVVGAIGAQHYPARVMDCLGLSHFIAFLGAAAVWRPRRIVGPDK